MMCNEADIVEYFVRSNLTYLDLLVIITGPTSDGTEAIIYKLIQERLPIVAWSLPYNYYKQTEILSPIVSHVRDVINPDFIFLLDADEIIYSSSIEQFISECSSIPEGRIGLIPWKTFIPLKQSAFIFDPTDWVSVLANESPQFYKIVIPRDVPLDANGSIAPGAHHVLGNAGYAYAYFNLTGISLAHFPVRNDCQLRHKILGGMLCKLLFRKKPLEPMESFHWKRIYDLFVSNVAVDSVQAAIHLYSSENTTCFPRFNIPEPINRYASLVCSNAPDVALAQRVANSLPASVSSPPLEPSSEFIDIPPIDFMLNKFLPESIIDFECGKGSILKHLSDKCERIYGVHSRQLIVASEISKELFCHGDILDFPKGAMSPFSMAIAINIKCSGDTDFVEYARSLTQSVSEVMLILCIDSVSGCVSKQGCVELIKSLNAFGWVVDYDSTYSVRLLSSDITFRKYATVMCPLNTKENNVYDFALLFNSENAVEGNMQNIDFVQINFPGAISVVDINGNTIDPLPCCVDL